MFIPFDSDSIRYTGRFAPLGDAMATAGSILIAAVFDLCGVIRMTWAGVILQICIIAGAGVAVEDHSGNGCAASVTIHDAGQKVRTILLFSRGRPVILSRCTAIQEFLKLVQIYRQTGRDAVQSNTDGFAMGLAKDGHF